MLARLTKAGTPAPTFNPVSLEADLHGQIEQFCKAKGWLYVHSRYDVRSRVAVGMTDFVIAADGGRTYWVEVKRPKGKATPAQLGTIAWLQKLGHTAGIVWSMDDFMKLVRG
jgi:hypothetical protein